MTLRIAITADLHWGIRPAGDAATREMVAVLHAEPPDLLILAGDVGAGDDFERCLALFDGLSCRKALVPGNHDIWVRGDDERGDSLNVYERVLPECSAAHGFHYLDHEPLTLPGLAIAGSMNWYDYSWSIDRLPAFADDWQERLAEMRFERGRHNDRRFVRWPHTDASFTELLVARLAAQLDALGDTPTLVVTHHPTFQTLNFPALGPATLDRLLWEAFSGNVAIEALLAKHAGRVPLAFCGHTHRARHGEHAGIRGYNVGGDYHFKRLLTLDWPAGTVSEREFLND